MCVRGVRCVVCVHVCLCCVCLELWIVRHRGLGARARSLGNRLRNAAWHAAWTSWMSGALEASAIPRHSGNATRKTINPLNKSRVGKPLDGRCWVGMSSVSCVDIVCSPFGKQRMKNQSYLYGNLTDSIRHLNEERTTNRPKIEPQPIAKITKQCSSLRPCQLQATGNACSGPCRCHVHAPLRCSDLLTLAADFDAVIGTDHSGTDGTDGTDRGSRRGIERFFV